MDVGDLVTVPYEGQPSWGRVEAVAGGRALIRLTVRAAADWTSPVTGGTVPAGCPRTYLLWLPAGDGPKSDGEEGHKDAAGAAADPLRPAAGPWPWPTG